MKKTDKWKKHKYPYPSPSWKEQKTDKWVEQYRKKFNEVLNRMYNLEILPNIQAQINERIPKGGYQVFVNSELEEFIASLLSLSRTRILEEIKGHLIYVFEELEPNADRNRILEYIKKSDIINLLEEKE